MEEKGKDPWSTPLRARFPTCLHARKPRIAIPKPVLLSATTITNGKSGGYNFFLTVQKFKKSKALINRCPSKGCYRTYLLIIARKRNNHQSGPFCFISFQSNGIQNIRSNRHDSAIKNTKIHRAFSRSLVFIVLLVSLSILLHTRLPVLLNIVIIMISLHIPFPANLAF